MAYLIVLLYGRIRSKTYSKKSSLGFFQITIHILRTVFCGQLQFDFFFIVSLVKIGTVIYIPKHRKYQHRGNVIFYSKRVGGRQQISRTIFNIIKLLLVHKSKYIGNYQNFLEIYIVLFILNSIINVSSNLRVCVKRYSSLYLKTI